jgi:hypothetical protein
MSNIVASAQFNDITNNQSFYAGKLMKIEGTHSVTYQFFYERDMSFIVIDGADACCALGMNIEWSDENQGVYPANGARIVVEGVYKKFTEKNMNRYGLEMIYLRVV